MERSGSRRGNPGEDKRNTPSALTLITMLFSLKATVIFWIIVFNITCIFSSSYSKMYLLLTLSSHLLVSVLFLKKTKMHACLLKYVLYVFCIFTELTGLFLFATFDPPTLFLHKFCCIVICKDQTSLKKTSLCRMFHF